MIFWAWLEKGLLSAGDWPFLFQETIRNFSVTSLAWQTNRNLGSRILNKAWLYFYYLLSGFISVNWLNFSWPTIERLFWFWPFLVLTIFSSYYLAKTLFPKEKMIRFLTPLFYLFNTYILMIVGGGQMGIALAYAVAPFVFAIFVRLIQAPKIKLQIISGLVLAFQVMLGPQISFITMGMTFFYIFFHGYLNIKEGLEIFILPFLVAVGLHFFWLLPIMVIKEVALPMGYGELGWVGFFSFSTFSNTISLLHPNWPENIFGKTYLMRPEFLILPLLAFSSLLFFSDASNNRVKKNILFFSLLALGGAFLAKGTNPPAGFIYSWLFEKIPGMRMFRDPTKFYLLVALAYSVLIPYTLKMILLKFKMLKR